MKACAPARGGGLGEEHNQSEQGSELQGGSDLKRILMLQTRGRAARDRPGARTAGHPSREERHGDGRDQHQAKRHGASDGQIPIHDRTSRKARGNCTALAIRNPRIRPSMPSGRSLLKPARCRVTAVVEASPPRMLV